MKKMSYTLFFICLLRRITCTLALVFSTLFIAQSQPPTFVPVAPDQLSSAFVRCIYKDSKGYMWFGLSNGLMRYDGTTLYRYEHTSGDSTSLPNNRINAIIEDVHQQLWIGTAQGLVIYNREKDNFLDVDLLKGNRNHLVNKYITSLAFDPQGKIWIGTHGNGLNIYDPQTFTFIHNADIGQENQVLTGNYITTLLPIKDRMWVGTKGGLKLFDTPALHTLPLPDMDPSITSKEINQVISDQSGNIWLGTADKEIIRLTPQNNRYQVKRIQLKQALRGEGAENILTLCLDASGNLWAGGENSGLYYLKASSQEIVHYGVAESNPNQFPTNSVRNIYVDNTGITWIGTHDKGAYLIDNNAKKFQTHQRNRMTEKNWLGNNVKALAEDKSGNIWMALGGGGLAKLDARTREIQFDQALNKKLETNHLYALLYDSNENLWIGTWGKGIYRLNLRTSELKNYRMESNGFGDNKVFCFYRDKNQKLWVGSVGSGLFYLDPAQDKFVCLNEESQPNHIPNTAYITSILTDETNTLWVASLFGLYKLKNTENNSYTYTWYTKENQSGIGSNEIQTIYKDSKKNLWFGSGDNGVSMLPAESSTFKIMRKQDGFLSNSVKAIVADKNGNIWFSSSRGLSKYHPATHSFQNYTHEDGLPSNEFNPNALLLAKDGKFYVGSYDGLVSFYPDSIKSNPVKPVIFLTDLKLNNQSVPIGTDDSPLQKHISLTTKIELRNSQHSFVLDFAALNYGQSSRNNYCYKLEGFDTDWNCIGEGHSATYTNLDPGHYVFFVKASNSDGVWSEQPARLEIVIHPALWKTWWALLVYIAVSAAIIFFLIRIRLERIKIKNQLEFERLAHEREHELSESKTQFFTNISHEFRTPLSLMAMPVESLISMQGLPPAVKERLDTIRTSSDKLMRLVNELMDFNKLESTKLKLRIQQGELVRFVKEITSAFTSLAQKRNIHFGVHSMVSSLDGWFDPDKLEKIIVNVLSNAFKFTLDNGQINVVIQSKYPFAFQGRSRERHLEIIIVDNGIGISAEELPFIFDKFYQAKSSDKIANTGTGIGLALTKGLLELHHGSITVESTPEQETKFIIRLPIDRESYADEDICEPPGYITTTEMPRPVPACEASVDAEGTIHSESDLPQILIVEDNEELRKYIALELSQQFHVIEATDGREGLEIAIERSPDLIVSDILMPGKTGMELCQEIKSNIKTSHIPVILLTAKATVEDQIEGIATGADVYITKPFSVRYLIAHVNQIVDSRKKLYSRFSQEVYLLPGKVASNEIDQAFLQKAIDYVIDHIQNPQLGVDSIADLFHLSRMQVYRKLKALTGKSVVDFIRMVRIKQALKLMETHQYTLSEIAFQTGFNSASYFTKCFKDQYGKAPSEYLAPKS